MVYVLTNSAMPGLVKIGRTAGADAGSRIAQLDTTGVPVSFALDYACRMTSANEVEQALHLALGLNRLNPKREFFRIDLEQASAILKLLHTEDATEEVEAQPDQLDAQSLAAAEQLKKCRQNLNVQEMGVPVDSLWLSTNSATSVVVIGPKRVRLRDEEGLLSAATAQVVQVDYPVAPAPDWTFNGKLLSDIYEETYGDV